MKRVELRITRIAVLLAAAAAAVPTTLFAGGLVCAMRAGGAGANAPSRITIVEAGKGEQPLLVEGQVVGADGTTPAAGVVVYVYQTDSSGYYNRQRGEPPRLRGWMRTDESGHYAYRTIRPAPYPERRNAAHVHVQLWGLETPPQWGTTLEFADDPLLPAEERQKSAALGRFAFVCSPNRDAQGVERCHHDLRLKTTADSFEPNTQHGWVMPPTASPATATSPAAASAPATGGRAGAAAIAGVGLAGASWGAARWRGKRRRER